MYQYAQVTGFPLSLIDVEATPITRIMLKFKYTSSDMNYQIGLQPGITYRIVYLDQGELKEIRGLIVGAYRHFSPSTQTGGVTTQTAEWMIRVDASEKNNALVVDIPTTQIRLCKIYTPHSEEDNSKITDATVYGGNTYGTITRATITGYKKDEDGNIIIGGDTSVSSDTDDDSGSTDDSGSDSGSGSTDDSGGTKIIDGDIDHTVHPVGIISGTNGGIAHGTNGNGSPVIAEGGLSVGGLIYGGNVVSGKVKGGEETIINGKPALVNCIIYESTIINSTIKEATTYNATVLDNTFINCVITNPVRTGSDVTVSGATIDSVKLISYGGWATGGVVTGPIAYGTQNGKIYIIHGTPGQTTTSSDDGTTYTTDTVITGIVGKGGVTSGGVGYGGIVSGGKAEGCNIIGGTVTGGIYSGGIDYGSTITVDITTGGWVTPGTQSLPPEAKESIMNGIKLIQGKPSSTNTSGDTNNSDWHNKTPLHDVAFDWDGLIIWNDQSKGVGSNIKTVML